VRFMSSALSLTLLIFGSFSTVLSASFYVSPTGSGTQCSPASPCSLQYGLSIPEPGDEVILLDGIYSEPLIITKGGSAGKSVVVRSANQWQSVFRMPTDRLARIWASYVTLRGVVFDGAGTGGNRGALRIGSGEEVTLPEAVHDVVVERVHIKDVRAAAVSITSGEHDVVVKDSVIENSGRQEFWGEAFYLGNKTNPEQAVYDIEIAGNIARGFTENAVETKRYSHDVRIHSNIFHNQMMWAEYGGDPERGNDGTITIDGHSNAVFNNRLFNNQCGMAVFVVEPQAGHRVFNNIVYNGVGKAEFAIRMKDWSPTWTAGEHPPSEVFNNTFYNLVSHEVGTLDPALLIIKNNIGINLEGNISSQMAVASMFQNAPEGDFHPVAACSAVDSASADPYAPTDYDAGAIIGEFRDMGALEFHGAERPQAVVRAAVGQSPSKPAGLKAKVVAE